MVLIMVPIITSSRSVLLIPVIIFLTGCLRLVSLSLALNSDPLIRPFLVKETLADFNKNAITLTSERETEAAIHLTKEPFKWIEYIEHGSKKSINSYRILKYKYQ